MANETAQVGIDLGGSKIEMIALDTKGKVLKQHRIATPVGEYEGTIQAIRRLILDFENETNLSATVGVGMPGSISSLTGMVKNSNSICLNGQPFKQDLELALNRSIMIENDANCFALSEATDGVAAKANSVFAVILGTGVGGGLVINGQLLSGVNTIAGEWGHNPLPWVDELELEQASLCYCGKKSCIETWLCGVGLSRNYEILSGQFLSPPEIISQLNSSSAAREALDLYHLRLAKALASVINVIDPDVIVLGGGLSNIQSLYQKVPDLWKEFVFSDEVKTQLLAAKFGDASGVRGAAWLGNLILD